MNVQNHHDARRDGESSLAYLILSMNGAKMLRKSDELPMVWETTGMIRSGCRLRRPSMTCSDRPPGMAASTVLNNVQVLPNPPHPCQSELATRATRCVS